MSLQKNSWSRRLSIFIFLLALLFLGEEMGQYFASSFSRIVGAVFLFCFLADNYVIWKYQRRNWKSLGRFAWTLFLFFMALIVSTAALSVALAVLIVLSWRNEPKPTEVKTGLWFLIYVLLKSYVPQFFLVERSLADGLNYLLQATLKIDIHYSPTAYGFGWLLMIVIFAITELSYVRKETWSKALFIAFIPLFYGLIQAGYYLFSTWFHQLPLPVGYGLDYYFYYLASLFTPMNGQMIQFMIGFGLTLAARRFFLGKDIQTQELEYHDSRRTKFGLSIPQMVMIVLFAVILFFYFNNSNGVNIVFRAPKPTIFVYDTKVDFQTVPDEKVFGVRNGLFGEMTPYFRDWGYQTVFFSDWGKIKLAAGDLLVIIDPSGPMPAALQKRLRGFIKNGGNLFFLGDHTYMFGLKNGYYDFVKDLGIKFNFDTAIYFREEWQGCLRSPYPTWDRIVKRSGFLTNVVQGASLMVNYPATPLIIGQYGWSDTGDLNNPPGYLGDRIYQTYEPTGDLVLAAQRDYGKGRIMVFGDTSFLQNSPISASYPLIHLCLTQLMARNRIVISLFWVIIFLLAIVLLLILISHSKLPWISNEIWILFLVVLMLGMGGLKNSGRDYFTIPNRNPDYQRAGIDVTNFPSFYATDWDSTQKTIGGFKNGIYRFGEIPYLIYSNDRKSLDNIDTLFILAPNRIISPAETNRIVNFVGKGGLLIAACGFEHRNALNGLFQKFQLDIQNRPYSYLSGKDTDRELRFISAWPLQLRGQGIRFDILCSTWDRQPLIVACQLGKGQAVFIGDSYFFENRNLEQSEMYYKNNVEFLGTMLKLKAKEQGNGQ